MEKGNFIDKVKNGAIKFFKGVKNFIVKTGRVNGSNCYGIIDGIGDFLVYEDHALISAVGMDDVIIKKENVLEASFEGLGKIRRNKATVKYKLVLDDNVVFPEKVREKNDVKNLTAVIYMDKQRNNFLASGQMEHGEGQRGLTPVVDCDVYKYDDCLVIIFKLERRVGEKVERYQESALYPFKSIAEIEEKSGKKFEVKFDDKKLLFFTTTTESAYNAALELKANK